MIKSMTGFGRSEEVSEDCKITVEMRAVNHRYCDINIRLPKNLLFLESKIRNLVKEYLERGKIDIFITYNEYNNHKIGIKYNEDLAYEYMNTFKSMEEKFNIINDIKVSSLAGFPEVIKLEEQTTNEDEVWTMLERVLIKATKDLVESRSLEGENLQEDLIIKLDELNKYVSYIEGKAPQIIEDYYINLRAKVEDLIGNTEIDESTLATGVATFADKVTVDEEIVRLKSHISNMSDTLAKGNGVGRKLDFIAQEMNREANTILSKVNDVEVTKVTINLKTEIEKIREQIQNIE